MITFFYFYRVFIRNSICFLVRISICLVIFCFCEKFSISKLLVLFCEIVRFVDFLLCFAMAKRHVKDAWKTLNIEQN